MGNIVQLMNILTDDDLGFCFDVNDGFLTNLHSAQEHDNEAMQKNSAVF